MELRWIGEGEEAALARFAAENVPGTSDPPDWWWLTSDYAERRAFIDPASQAIAALCLAVPSRWRLDGGDVDVRSICGWYVAPAYKGQRLGQRLVEAVAAETPHLNTLSISEPAAKSFAGMGWTGPHRAFLRLLPLPAWRFGGTGGLRARTVDVRGGDLPLDVGQAVDAVEAQAKALPRRRRSASDWTRRLGVFPWRFVRFHLLERYGKPIAYAVTRAADRTAGKRYRCTRLHFMIDFVIGALGEGELEAAFRAIATGVPRSAGFLLFCTSSAPVATAASRSGWLDEGSPLIGPSLRAKAPLYMLGGAFAAHDGKDLGLTFCDSDVDLNL